MMMMMMNPNGSSNSGSSSNDSLININNTTNNINNGSQQQQQGIQACAACKFQRRKCPTDCPLAPYFPAEANQRFLSCKRLFGVSNMLRFLRDADPTERDDTMKSLIYEAEVRDRDPVNGCLGIIGALSEEVKNLQRELELTRSLVHQQQRLSTGLLLQQQQQPSHHHHHHEALAQPLSSCLGSIGSNTASSNHHHPLALPLYRPHLSLDDPFDFETHMDHKYLIKP